MDKRGKWNVGSAFDLNQASDLIDDKMVRNMATDLRKQLGADALKPHKPLLAGPGGIPISAARSKVHNNPGSGLHGNSRDLAAMHNRSPARSGSKDGDLMSTMVQRLAKLEQMNGVLKSELSEKNAKIRSLEDQNS